MRYFYMGNPGEYEKLLVIDESIAKSQTEHTKDPDTLQRRRAAVGSAIEEITRTLKQNH